MEAKIIHQEKGMRTQDGAGVRLVRVLSNRTVAAYDPLLMLDSFDSTDPSDYLAGFPMHPHRGIETITYLRQGKMTHRDSLGKVFVEEKTAVRLAEGDQLTLQSAGSPIEALFFESQALEEPVAWGGPVVMNTQEELEEAFRQLREGTFIQDQPQGKA